MYGYEVAREEERRNIPAGITAAVIAMLEENLKSLSADAYEKAVDSLLQAEKIEVYGVENSHTVCSDLCTKLTYLGLNCRCFTDTYLQRISAENLKPTDAAVGISYSGSFQRYRRYVKSSKKAGGSYHCPDQFPGLSFKQICRLCALLQSEAVFLRRRHFFQDDTAGCGGYVVYGNSGL